MRSCSNPFRLKDSNPKMSMREMVPAASSFSVQLKTNIATLHGTPNFATVTISTQVLENTPSNSPRRRGVCFDTTTPTNVERTELPPGLRGPSPPLLSLYYSMLVSPYTTTSYCPLLPNKIAIVQATNQTRYAAPPLPSALHVPRGLVDLFQQVVENP